MTAVIAMIPASRGQKTMETVMQIMGWMMPRTMMFQKMLGISETRKLWVSISKVMMEMRWRMRLKTGTRTGPVTASIRLVREMRRQRSGNTALINTVPSTPFTT